MLYGQFQPESGPDNSLKLEKIMADGGDLNPMWMTIDQHISSDS
jgi:hypothetical protein